MLYRDVPSIVFVVLLTSMLICVIVTLALKGLEKGWRMSCLIILAAYLILLYASTVIFRSYESNHGYNFMPFWSYRNIERKEDFLFQENLLNILAFIPLGVLLGSAFRGIKCWQVIIKGLLISVSIEVLQFLLNRGFSEFDDVFHNVLGCLIGYGVYKGIFYLVIKAQRKSLILV